MDNLLPKYHSFTKDFCDAITSDKMTKEDLVECYDELHKKVLKAWTGHCQYSFQRKIPPWELRLAIKVSYDIMLWIDENQCDDGPGHGVLQQNNKSLIQSLAIEIAVNRPLCRTIFPFLDSKDRLKKELIIEIFSGIGDYNLRKYLCRNHEEFIQFSDDHIMKELAFSLCRLSTGQELLSHLLDRPCFDKNTKKQLLAASLETEKDWDGEDALYEAARNIQKFEVDDENLLKKVALKLTEKKSNFHLLLEKLDCFGFSDDKFLILLVEKAIESGVIETLCKSFPKFGFDEATRCDFANRLAQIPQGIGTIFVPMYIENFQLSDEDTRYQLALLISKVISFYQRDINLLVKQIHKFELPDSILRELLIFPLISSVPDIHTMPAFREIEKSAEEISKIDHPELKKDLANWFHTALGKIAFSIKDPMLQKQIIESRIIRLIYQMRDMEIRRILFQEFWYQLMVTQEDKRVDLVKQLTSPSYAATAKLLLRKLERKKSFNQPDKEETKFDLDTLVDKRKKFLRDNPKCLTLLKLLHNLSESDDVYCKQIIQIFRYLRTLTRHKLDSESQVLNILIKIEKTDLITFDLSGDQDQVLQSLLREFYYNLPNFNFKDSERLHQLFFQGRHPEALPLYLFNMIMLPEEQKGLVLHSLQTYIHEVLNGDFNIKRYEGSSHLDEFFSKNKNLEREWKQGETRPLTDFLKEKVPEKAFNLASFMTSAVKNGHLPPELCPNFVKTLGINPGKKRKSHSNQKLDDLLTSLIVNPKNLSKPLLNQIESELNRCDTPPELLNDLAVLRDELKPKIRKNFNRLKIVDTDHYWDLFLCGTEVTGSCQRVNGKSSSRALLGYVMDGKYRMVAIQDSKSGRILGRSMLRFLLSEDGEPLLYFEEIYPSNLSGQFQEALIQFAKTRADKLGVDLVSNNWKIAHGDCIGSAFSCSSRAPFEYCDALGSIELAGIQTGNYEIPDCRLMQKNRKSKKGTLFQIREINEAIGWGSYNSSITKIYRQNPRSILITKIDDIVVGYSVFRKLSEKEGSVPYVATKPEYQHQGIGTKIMLATIEQARSDGIERISLQFRKNLKHLTKFYCKTIPTQASCTATVMDDGCYSNGDPRLNVEYSV